jgi:hypothetical protein
MESQRKRITNEKESLDLKEAQYAWSWSLTDALSVWVRLFVQ